jgi:AcrR family transcriptional regulator
MTAEQRRAALLHAAAEVFCLRGYHAASMAEIADRAGITKPVIYHHFGSKRALHSSVFAHYSELLLAAAAERGRAPGLREALSDVVLAMFDFAHEHPAAWHLLLGGSSDPETARLQQQLREAGTRLAASRLLSEPGFDPPASLGRKTTATVLAQLTRSAVDGLVDWSLQHPSVSRARLAQIGSDILWNGLVGYSARAD